MREIKFRAWNKHHKRMYRVYSICFDTDTVGAQDIEKRTTHTFGFIDLDIHQFTGLQDKNGKDIYEGDIVHLWGYGKYTCEYPFTELWEAYQENDIGEILGNIHENPELMECQND